MKSSLVTVKRLNEADMEAVIRESCSLELVSDSCNVVKVFGPVRVATLQDACCIVMDYVDDYLDGVQYMMKNEMRQFNHDIELPYMALICVRAGSISVMRMLAKRWKAVLVQQHILVHEVCASCVVNKQTDYADMLRLLLFELGLEYDTWYDSSTRVEFDLKKPIHKLAIAGKTDMIQVILARASMDGHVGYIDTSISASKGRETALTYAVGVDNVEATLFLISQGAGRGSGSRLFNELFGVALNKGSARVATWILRNAPKRGSEDVNNSHGKSKNGPEGEDEDEDGTQDASEDGPEDEDESEDRTEDEDETVDEYTLLLAEFQDDPAFEQNLAVLETHMKLVQLDGHMESHPVLLACSKERQQAFECLAWLGVLRHTEEVVPLVCERGTVAMLKLLLDVGLDLEAHGAKLLRRAIQFNNEEVSEFIINYLVNFNTSALSATREPHTIKKTSKMGQQEEAVFGQDYEHDQLFKTIAYNDAGRLALELRALRSDKKKEIMEKLALCCCENNNVQLLRLLEAEGLDIKEASDRLGFLQRAISSHELVKYILER